MQTIFKYSFDRHTIYRTCIYFVVFAVLGVGLYYLYEGGYFSAWFCSFIVALVALMSLSVPRKIVVDQSEIKVLCVLDMTHIQLSDIASVKSVNKKQMKWMMPIFGSWGFFGYYGYFLDLKNFERVKIYATEWSNFVEIVDIYEDRLYVSCSEADKLVKTIADYKLL